MSTGVILAGISDMYKSLQLNSIFHTEFYQTKTGISSVVILWINIFMCIAIHNNETHTSYQRNCLTGENSVPCVTLRRTVHRPRIEKVYKIHSSEYLTKSVTIKTECWKHQCNLHHFRLVTSYKNVEQGRKKRFTPPARD
jgi:hypothetical protein